MILGPGRSYWLGWAIVLATNMAIALGVSLIVTPPIRVGDVALAVFAAHMVLTLVTVVILYVQAAKRRKAKKSADGG